MSKLSLNEFKSELKNLIVNKVDKIDGKGLSANDYTTTEKNKLTNVALNANNYIHPSTHPASMIIETPNEKIMTAEERSKLSNVALNANNYIHPSTHPASMITGLPTSLPANGGNANTVNGHKVTVSATAPSSPSVNDIWIQL